MKNFDSRRWFKKYQSDFEAKLISKPLQALAKEELVAVRPGKMAKSKFAMMLGNTFNLGEPVAIDYYGHFKKSTGLLKWVVVFRKEHMGTQVRMVTAKVIHFASIKIEHVADFAPELVAGFPQFKDMILKMRGFHK